MSSSGANWNLRMPSLELLDLNPTALYTRADLSCKQCYLKWWWAEIKLMLIFVWSVTMTQWLDLAGYLLKLQFKRFPERPKFKPHAFNHQLGYPLLEEWITAKFFHRRDSNSWLMILSHLSSDISEKLIEVDFKESKPN